MECINIYSVRGAVRITAQLLMGLRLITKGANETLFPVRITAQLLMGLRLFLARHLTLISPFSQTYRPAFNGIATHHTSFATCHFSGQVRITAQLLMGLRPKYHFSCLIDRKSQNYRPAFNGIATVFKSLICRSLYSTSELPPSF